MSTPFIATIRPFGFNWAPQGWALCNGQLLAVSQNEALFSLIGTIYGGDGRTTFGLPDLRGRVSLHEGSGPGLTPRKIGAKGGAVNVTLITQELPSHRHTASANNQAAASTDPAGRVPAIVAAPTYSSTVDAPMNANMIGLNGGNGSHNNIQPYQVISWCIALVGIYPSRN